MATGNTIATLLVKIGVQFSELNKGVKQVEGKMKGLQGSFKKTAKQIGLIFGGHQILQGAKEVIKASSDFQLELAKLNNVANLSIKDLNAVGNASQKLASQFGVSSNEIVHGLTELRKLGYETADSLKELPTILKFNVAAGAEFDTTITLMETTMNDFGKTLKDTKSITDTFTKALSSVNNLTAKDLADAFTNAGASAKNAHASIADLSAATAILAAKGFSGAEAGTSLNAVFANLNKTGGTAQKALHGVGISITDSAGRLRPFGNVVTDIQKKMQGMTDDQKNFFAQQIAGKEHMSKFIAIVKGAPGSFEEFSASLGNAAGSTDKAFKGINATASQSMKRLESSFEVFKQKLGSSLSPAITAVSNALSGLINWFNQLSPEVQEIIGYLGGAIAIFAGLATVVGTLALAFSLLSGPILLIVGSIALLIAGFLYLWNNSDKVSAALKSGWKSVGEFFSGLWDSIVSGIEAFGKFLLDSMNDIISGIEAGWNGIGEFFSGLWDGIVAGVEAFGQFFVNLWNGIVGSVVAAFEWLYNHNYYFEALVDAIVNWFNTAKSFITSVWNDISSYLTSKWDLIKSKATSVFNSIKNTIKTFVDAIVRHFNKAKSFTTSVWNTITNFLSSKWTAIKSKATSVFNSIKNTISSIWSKISNIIKSWANKAYQWGSNFINMLIKGIKSKINSVIGTVKNIGKRISNILGFHSPTKEGPLSDSDKWMPNFMNMLEQGLEMGIPKLQMAVGDVAATISMADTFGSSSSVVNNINVNSRQNNLDERGLGRMLERMRILNGGSF